jgi:two-component system, cell cycle sensor histidine kinase and response regulator CckA
MNTATPFPWPGPSAGDVTTAAFATTFEHAPIAVARCNSAGVIVEMNPALEQTLEPTTVNRRSLHLCDLVGSQHRDKIEALLCDLISSRRNSFTIESHTEEHDRETSKVIAWRQPGQGVNPAHILLLVERRDDTAPAGESFLQTQRWEAVGRLAGGVVHDFNNLLTGVMLYCDLLLTSLDPRDRRRRYADEIRSAIVQATGLVRQLLVFARPQSAPARLLCLNEIVSAMHDLLARLIGENISLDMNLDPDLGSVEIDQAQAQQIILNLVLNARDALPKGGRISVETSNYGFQPISPSTTPSRPPPFPCVLLMVSDNGHGMSAATRQRIFEPFFTTKNAGQGTGLGLTTVRSIVTTNHGLIHFESEPGRGTRVMILLPTSSPPDHPSPLSQTDPDPGPSSPTTLQENKKESLL